MLRQINNNQLEQCDFLLSAFSLSLSFLPFPLLLFHLGPGNNENDAQWSTNKRNGLKRKREKDEKGEGVKHHPLVPTCDYRMLFCCVRTKKEQQQQMNKTIPVAIAVRRHCRTNEWAAGRTDQWSSLFLFLFFLDFTVPAQEAFTQTNQQQQ